MIFAIDPGNEKSAYVLYDPNARNVLIHGKVSNQEMIELIRRFWCTHTNIPFHCRFAIEKIASYGMKVGASVFDTCIWSGRFAQRLYEYSGVEPTWVFRREVKLYLCNSMRAKDCNVRQAIIDMFGGREKAIGKKKSPGPLYGVKADVWAALGVALTIAEGENHGEYRPTEDELKSMTRMVEGSLWIGGDAQTLEALSKLKQGGGDHGGEDCKEDCKEVRKEEAQS